MFDAVCFTIFDIPGYFFFTGIGIVIAVSVFMSLLVQKKYSVQKNMYALAIACVFTFLFARLFGCLSGIYRDVGMGRLITLDTIKETGIVFYGGLIGLLISYSVISRHLQQDKYVMDVLAVCIPLFHAISRIGCFVGGCCFGIESESFVSIEYSTRIFGEIDTSYRIPIQLIEAVFNIVIFIYLLLLLRKDEWINKHILRRYLLIYSIGRFIIEFYRGDLTRGVINGISFSQIVSIVIWLFLIISFIYGHSEKNKKEDFVL